MRNLLLLPPLLLGASAAFPCEPIQPDGSPQDVARTIDEETRAVTLDLTGMTWAAGWTPRVRGALESLPWVRKTTINFANRQATVTVVSKSYDEKAILEALEEAGFGASVAKAPSKEKKSAQVPAGAQVAFRVSGMKKTRSGATWVGWPDKVTEALEGTHATHAVTWNYETDTVTITYDPKKTDPARLAKVIRGLEYGAEQVPVEKPAAARGFEPYPAPLPEGAPAEFARAFQAAREAGQPILIDFWATWCAPCIRLKQQTLESSEVRRALEGVEVLYVDLDANPELASSYGVTSIPDVFFIDARGEVTDRLRAFEEPEPFLERVGRWLAPKKQVAVLEFETAVPSAEVSEALRLENNVRVLGREVTGLEPGGAAARAGLRVGDVVLSLGGNDLYSTDDVADFLSVAAPGDRVKVILRRIGEADPVELVATLGGASVAVAESPGIEWQYASLGQLPLALEEARARKKKVLVGLSGAETWWPSTRFESSSLSAILDDPEVVRATEDHVRVIVRRPHAYFFIDDLFEDRGGIQQATPSGCTLADGTSAPLPGVYLLSAEGEFLAGVALTSPDARASLLRVLADDWALGAGSGRVPARCERWRARQDSNLGPSD